LFSETSPSLMRAFGIFGVINFPLFYAILSLLPGEEDNGWAPRIIAFGLCSVLSLMDYWPQRLKPYLGLYWHLTVLYCLPLFGTYMFLENSDSTTWLTNNVLGLFWLVLVTDWLTFIVIFPLGVFLGWVIHTLIFGISLLPGGFFPGPFVNYLWAIVIAAVFARNKEIFHKERLNSMKVLAGAIAHELRTPLSAISMTSQILKSNVPAVMDGYKKAKAANLSVEDIDEDYMEQVSDEIDLTTRNAFGIIDMVLMNLKDGSEKTPPEPCSMNACIKNALKSYPLTAEEEGLVHWENPGHDFTFQGNDLFMRHVLFNLLKNALHYVKAANKGAIFIRTEETPKENILIFKDTGMGMPASMVPHVFDRFYSRTQHGTGIGLAFCKSVLEGIGGKITCESIQGEHTTFILSIPR